MRPDSVTHFILLFNASLIFCIQSDLYLLIFIYFLIQVNCDIIYFY